MGDAWSFASYPQNGRLCSRSWRRYRCGHYAKMTAGHTVTFTATTWRCLTILCGEKGCGLFFLIKNSGKRNNTVIDNRKSPAPVQRRTRGFFCLMRYFENSITTATTFLKKYKAVGLFKFAPLSADDRTWTCMGRPIRTWTVRVCQFHHIRFHSLKHYILNCGMCQAFFPR